MVPRRDLQQWLDSASSGLLRAAPAWCFYWVSSTHFSALVPWSCVPAGVEVASADVGLEACQVFPYSGGNRCLKCGRLPDLEGPLVNQAAFIVLRLCTQHTGQERSQQTSVTTAVCHGRMGTSWDTRGQIVLFGTSWPVLT